MSAASASSTEIRPAPTAVAGKRASGPATGCAVLVSSLRISSGPSAGWACRSSAAAPAVSGAAIEVPLYAIGPLPVPTSAETTSSPGATTSGFSSARSAVGPRLLNPAR
ncbi:MAG: hypothetical protein IPM79_13525 [Polyangiaceae bacterium]|nr:hypothetical protein [Polyangiaceae bacterium]